MYIEVVKKTGERPFFIYFQAKTESHAHQNRNKHKIRN